MSTQPPFPEPIPSAAQPPQPGLSVPSRIINIFIAPRKTFEDLKVNASWWSPWVLTSIFLLLFAFVVGQKVDMVRFTRQQVEQSKFAQRQMEQLSPQQQEQNIRIRAIATKVGFFIFPIGTLIGGLIIAAILMGVFNFVFAAEVPYGRALAIVFYSFVPRIIYMVLLIVSLLASADPNTIDISANPMPTNPGFFMDPQGSKFLFGLASGWDLFALWVVALLGFGFSAASSNRKFTPGTAISTVMVLYGVLILAGAALKAAF